MSCVNSYREFIHWVVINIPGTDITAGDELLSYVSAAPPCNSGLHRYVFLIYEQNGGKIDGSAIVNSGFASEGRGGQKTSVFLKGAALQGNSLSLFAAAAFEAEWDEGCDHKHNVLGFIPPPQYQSPKQKQKQKQAEDSSSASSSSANLLGYSRLGFGCWQLGSKGTDDYWELEYTQEMANKMVSLAASNGFTYFDTAGDYAGGDSEKQLGIALKNLDAKLRSKVIVGSKVIHF